MNSKGTQPHIDVYPFSPTLPSQPGCHITLNTVPCEHFFLYKLLGGTTKECRVEHGAVSLRRVENQVYRASSPTNNPAHQKMNCTCNEAVRESNWRQGKTAENKQGCPGQMQWRCSTSPDLGGGKSNPGKANERETFKNGTQVMACFMGSQ